MQNKMVSIILPVFNAERFLPQCLDSILRQTYQEWDLIAVDDGSKDGSMEILKSYEKRDNRIHIISKKNEGVSIARNIALEHAHGDYIYFVDSDDIVMSEALMILVKAMESNKTTFVKSDFLPIDEQGKQVFINKKQVIRRRYDGKVMDSEKFFKKILMKEYFLWTCLFQKDIIVKNHIQFIPHCRLMEDAAFVVDYLLYSDRNVYKDACVYGYRKYEGTVSAVNKDYTEDMMLIKRHLLEFPKSELHINLLKMIASKLDENTSSTIKKKMTAIYHYMERVRFAFMYYIYK